MWVYKTYREKDIPKPLRKAYQQFCEAMTIKPTAKTLYEMWETINSTQLNEVDIDIEMEEVHELEFEVIGAEEYEYYRIEEAREAKGNFLKLLNDFKLDQFVDIQTGKEVIMDLSQYKPIEEEKKAELLGFELLEQPEPRLVKAREEALELKDAGPLEFGIARHAIKKRGKPCQEEVGEPSEVLDKISKKSVLAF